VADLFFSKANLVIVLSILAIAGKGFGQIIIDEPPLKIYYDRTMRVTNFLKMKDMRDVLHKDELLLGKNRISGNISYNTGRVLLGEGDKPQIEYRKALAFFTRIRFVEEFSFNTMFYKDFNPLAAAPWIADYSYSIGRYNWRNNKFNYGYENYVNNKYSDNNVTFTEKFKQGYYFVSFNKSLSDSLTKKIKLDNTTSVKFVFFARYAFDYLNQYNDIEGGLLNGKSTVGLSVRYTVYKNIYLESAVYYYPEQYKQQAWDPDYTYGFGYFNWRAFRLSLTYGNWAINRFPWNKMPYPMYGFIDGNFRIIANYIW